MGIGMDITQTKNHIEVLLRDVRNPEFWMQYPDSKREVKNYDHRSTLGWSRQPDVPVCNRTETVLYA
jgi:hypothetical protein